MDYIDGHVPFTKKSVDRLFKVLIDIDPSLVIGADPVYSIDWHTDHMATAYNSYFAVKIYRKTSKIVGYFLYQSFKPNAHFPEQSWDVFERTLLPHRSQMTPMGVKLMRNFLEKIYYPLKCHKIGLREVDFGNPRNVRSMMDKIKYSLFSGKTPAIPSPDLYHPSPQELGLNPDPS